MRLPASFGALNRAGVLSLNKRNGECIMALNSRKQYPLVDDKILTKKVLSAVGMPVPGLLGVVNTSGSSGKFEEKLQGKEEFVIKPANGAGGDGILVIKAKRNDMYQAVDGMLYQREELAHHLTNVISGLYSLGGQPDRAMLEELVQFDPVFEKIAFQGVPDIRVIVYRGVPVMSMVRLPTRSSHGKANLHQGAIGAGIDIRTGKTIGGVMGNLKVDVHVDTGAPIIDFQVPQWDRILEMSAHCYEAVKLGYLGVDLVLDRNRGPLVLELNARPGLNIQIANGEGLKHRLEKVESTGIHAAFPADRVVWAREVLTA